MNCDEKKKFDEDVRRACAVMRAGGVILYPTDTVWGLGCDATDASAVRRVFAIKQRAESKSLITLVDSPEMLGRHVAAIPEIAAECAASADGRPVTMVLDGARGMAAEVIAADGSAGFRITREAYSSALCRCLGHPVVSTSANISGRPSPAIFAEIEKEIIDAVDYTAAFRRDDTSRSLPSKIVKIGADGAITVLRP